MRCAGRRAQASRSASGAPQWSRLARALAGKPSAVNIPGDLWTLPKFAEFVERVAGKRCERTMAFRILTSMGYWYDPPPPPPPFSYHVRRGPGKWIKKYNATVPPHLLPP